MAVGTRSQAMLQSIAGKPALQFRPISANRCHSGVMAWYRKSEATFSDVLALVRRMLWAEKYCTHSADQPEPHEFSSEDWEVLRDQLAATA